MNPYQVNLADIALEVKGDLKITWNGIEFNDPEGGALNVVSKKKNPLLNQLIEEA